MSEGVASARLDLSICVLSVPRAPLARALAELGPLELGATAGRGRAAICLELWDVREGRMRMPGLEQERLYEAGGMWMGSVYGALLGPLGSASLGLLGRRFGAALSSAATRALGCYRELLIGVPEAQLAGVGPCYFVAGMRADSPFAIAADGFLGYGFDKRAASFSGALASGLAVRDASGGTELLRARLDDGPHERAGSSPLLERVVTWLDRPLLAGSRQRLSLSRLRRSNLGELDRPAARVKLQLGALHPWLAPGDHRAELVRARDVGVELSLPRPVHVPELKLHG